MEMKILIKGAGDLATGIASRLYHSGHKILMTEIAVPLAVRRMVSLSRAVYEGKAEVEDMEGVLVSSMEEAEAVFEKGNIPVIVDEKAAVLSSFHPDVVVDAILAKKNTGTRIDDAPFVIGVGPGFTAGTDCHCVIETKRGHTLGDVIYKGSALPNTGIPGNVGGFSIERLIKASADGRMHPIVSIGDMVHKDQVVALTGDKEVYASMTGIVRGMLQKDVQVIKGQKIGDIDARCEEFHCFSISDKARAVGGAVLEAVTSFEHMKGKYAMIVLAAGKSVRFGENKLLADIKGERLYKITLEKMKAFQDFPQFIVTGYDPIIKDAEKQNMTVVKNDRPEEGMARSIKLGMQACLKTNPDIQGILFLVCDQPQLDASTIQRILNTASVHRGQIVAAAYENNPGNPVLFDRKYFKELLKLEADHGGREIMHRTTEKIWCVEAESRELTDIDKKTDLPL